MDATTRTDWQVLLSAYAPLVLYGAARFAEWVVPRFGDLRVSATR